MPFFRLWPENLQLELSRVLCTEVLVRQESVLARGTPCTRVVFVLSGKVGQSFRFNILWSEALSQSSVVGAVSYALLPRAQCMNGYVCVFQLL